MNSYLHLNSWAGHTAVPVEILKETLKRYRVKLLADCLKDETGKLLYVPKYAVTSQKEMNNE